MSSARGAFRAATYVAWLLIRNVRNASCWTSGVLAHRSSGVQGGFLIVCAFRAATHAMRMRSCSISRRAVAHEGYKMTLPVSLQPVQEHCLLVLLISTPASGNELFEENAPYINQGIGDTLAQRAVNIPHKRVRGKLVWDWWVSGSMRPQGARFMLGIFNFNGTSGRAIYRTRLSSNGHEA
eukprot:1149172-Pelagomonas_calceolata.AAC.1